jgi:polysaccharide biosynthesis protein PslH
MKVLFLMPYTPIPSHSGGALRMYHLLKHLANHHEVTVLTFGTPEDRELLLQAFPGRLRNVTMLNGSWVRKYRRIAQFYALWTRMSFFEMLAHTEEMQRCIVDALEKNDFDVVQTEFSHMAHYEIPGSVPKILDAHNIEFEIFRQLWKNAASPLHRLHYRQEYRRFFKNEVAIFRRQDAIFATSSNDSAVLDLHCPSIPKYVIPNGVDTDYFRPEHQTPEPYSLVFTGTMAYSPNSDGACYFLDEIFPRIKAVIPQVKIYIVGQRPPKHLLQRASDSVVVTNSVPDVRPYIERALVYVVPLRMGSGTRLKILEAMAMRKPIVTTTMGSEGIPVVDRESALVADRPEAFADAVVELIRNRDLRDRLAGVGYELSTTQYDWNVIGQKMLSC